MNKNKVITNMEQLTPEWLTNIFRNNGYLSHGSVTAISSKKTLSAISSNAHSLELIFSDDAKAEEVSSTIIVKTPLPDEKFLGQHEAKFYSIVAKTMNKMPIPKCYDSVFSEETGLSHIILENLSKTHSEYGFFIPGVTPPPLKRYCERAIDCLAEIHAFWWDNPKLKDLSKHSYVLCTFKENAFNEEEISKWFKSQERFIDFLEDRVSNKRYELVKTIFSLFPHFAYERLTKENITIIHGDSHFWNFFYPKDIYNEKFKVYLTDWQMWGIGVGCQDLAYMLGLFFNLDDRHLVEKDLIKRYHNDLLTFGVKDYSLNDCWYDYKLLVLLNLYRIVWWWSLNVPPTEILRALNIAMLNIEDLNCMDLLESK
ncbi:MAG: phosphotransferase [Candidatus Thorarchaeota archaeon]